MLRHLVAFCRLSRPVFLLGGVALFALGAGIARKQGCAIDPVTYLLGQVCVTSLQLMTHYLNEYWDFDADGLNTARTMFSGGSGVLVAGLLPRKTALGAGMICLTVGATVAAWLIAIRDPGPIALGVLLITLLGAYFYSSPPLVLASSGIGELTASLVVAGLVPTLGLFLFGGRLSMSFAAAVLPLIPLHFAMLLAFEFPDERSDRLAGKRTLVVRLGITRAKLIHNGSLAGAIVLGAMLAFARKSSWEALPVIVVAPLAVWQMLNVAALNSADRPSAGRLTFLAISIFAIAVSATVVVWCV